MLAATRAALALPATMMVAALALVAARIIAAAVLPPLCTKALPPEKCQRIGAGDYRQFPAANHSICAAACCADARCGSWNWDASMSVPATMPACRSGGKSLPCCYLKGGGLENCTGNSTANDPAAWSGVARPGKPVQPRPAPAPPAPPAHRSHSSAGTPDGMSASYDCEVRKHAWEFGKATLPRHGSFKTLFDALQLRQCEGVTAPPTVDAFVPPYFSTPTHGHVIYADSTAPAGGDGTLARPFATLEAGLAAAAASASSNTTLLLRRGRYHTSGVVLTSAHSGLTIQNYEGEAAIVSGSVAVPGSAKNWSPHKKQTNTWKLDLSSIDGMPTQAFGMRVGSRRATPAQWLVSGVARRLLSRARPRERDKGYLLEPRRLAGRLLVGGSRGGQPACGRCECRRDWALVRLVWRALLWPASSVRILVQWAQPEEPAAIRPSSPVFDARRI